VTTSPPLDCTALAPGLWRIALPFPSPLGFSFCYVVHTSDGVVLVDTGWDLDEGWDLFRAGLTRAGAALDDIRGVVVTHAHPDHYGLTRRLQERTEAWVGLHPAERAQLVPLPGDRERRIAQIESWLIASGVPAGRIDEVMADRDRLLIELSPNLPTVDITDGDVIPGTDGALTAVHTPGHTPGHLVFHDRSRRVLFTGDHLLPRISANVSVRPTSGLDPLEDYARSLDALDPYRATLAAPGHEWSFDRLQERVDVVRRHHDERLLEVLAAATAGSRTAWEVAHAISWSRPFHALNARGTRSAIGETAAHLVRLERSGLLVRGDGEPLTWYPTGASPDPVLAPPCA
jgi:glyoxylase-like metal-dependent hydrolase (beta-lactamase superfamily II)